MDDDDDFADIYGDDAPKVKDEAPGEPVVKQEATEVKQESRDDVAAIPASNSAMYAPPPTTDFAPVPAAPVDAVVSEEERRRLEMQARGINTGNIYIPPKDEGKMFIGGLNWETTDESLKAYFSNFGNVLECTVMRDNATGRSRGFGFLTFEGAESVNRVLAQEHVLDGKIIDPKRAIPREEQDKTAKIFVGGVGIDVTERDFKQFFDQYGTVIDAQLMIDKDTGRPRGFGFVTFDSDKSVESIVAEKFLILKNKPIEVKRAEPRTRGELAKAEVGHQGSSSSAGSGDTGNSNVYNNGMSPAMMSQYYQKWQQYMQQFQQIMQAQAQAQANGESGEGNDQQSVDMMQMQMQQYQQMMQMQMQQSGQMMPDGDSVAAAGEGYTPDGGSQPGESRTDEDDGHYGRDRDRDRERSDSYRERDRYGQDRDRDRGRYRNQGFERRYAGPSSGSSRDVSGGRSPVGGSARGGGGGGGGGGDTPQLDFKGAAERERRRSRSPPANAPLGPRWGASSGNGGRRRGSGGDRRYRGGNGGYYGR